MPRYVQMIRRTNPGSIVELQRDLEQIERGPLFKRVFLGMDALKRGFLAGCAPFIFFDGCHLRGKYSGYLLSAVGQDPDFGIFPLAMAVVESENKESWGFFLHCLTQMLGSFHADHHWHFIVDRQKV